MPWHLILRLIELLFHVRKRHIEDTRPPGEWRPAQSGDLSALQPWHNESDVTARTNRPYPGT